MISDLIILLVYVDHVLIIGNSFSLIHLLINKLGKEFSLKDVGKLHYF